MRFLLPGLALLALSPDAPAGVVAPEGGTQPDTVTMSRAELQAMIDGAVTKATEKDRAQIETWQKAALDGAWDAAHTQHQVPEELRPLVRAQWDQLKPAEGEHRPDPAKWLPEQPFFKALKPAPLAPEAPKTSGRPTVEVASKPAPAAPPAGLPAYLTRGPGSTGTAPTAQPASTPRDALRVAVAAAKTAEA